MKDEREWTNPSNSLISLFSPTSHQQSLQKSIFKRSQPSVLLPPQGNMMICVRLSRRDFLSMSYFILVSKVADCIGLLTWASLATLNASLRISSSNNWRKSIALLKLSSFTSSISNVIWERSIYLVCDLLFQPLFEEPPKICTFGFICLRNKLPSGLYRLFLKA